MCCATHSRAPPLSQASSMQANWNPMNPPTKPSIAYAASHLCALTLPCSLANNGLGLGPEGYKAVAAVLDKTQITSLKCASHLAQRLTFAWTLCLESTHVNSP